MVSSWRAAIFGETFLVCSHAGSAVKRLRCSGWYARHRVFVVWGTSEGLTFSCVFLAVCYLRMDRRRLRSGQRHRGIHVQPTYLARALNVPFLGF